MAVERRTKGSGQGGNEVAVEEEHGGRGGRGVGGREGGGRGEEKEEEKVTTSGDFITSITENRQV